MKIIDYRLTLSVVSCARPGDTHLELSKTQMAGNTREDLFLN